MFPLQEKMRVREGNGTQGTCLLPGKIPRVPYQSCLFNQKQSYGDSKNQEIISEKKNEMQTEQ